MKSLILILGLFISIFADSYTLQVVENPTIGAISINDMALTYTHTDTNDIKYFVLDSCMVRAIDEANNVGDTTQLYILIVPEFKLEMFAIGNPLIIDGDNVEQVDPSLYSQLNLGFYNMPRNGMAIVIQCERPLDYYRSIATAIIFDAVGNLVSEEIYFRFIDYDNTSYGVAIWDGMNENNRYVGNGSYLVYVETKLYTADAPLQYQNVYIEPEYFGERLQTIIGVKKD